MDGKECKEKLNRYIWRRENVPNVSVNLRKLLRQADMEQYLEVCSNRIADAQLLDGENVEIDFLDFPNLLLDVYGITYCYDILKGYINESTLEAYKQYAICEQKIIDGINKQLEILRMYDTKSLISILTIRKNKIKTIPDYQKYKHLVKEAKEQVLREFLSRTIFNKARLKIKKIWFDVYFNIRHYRLASVFREIKKKYKE